MHPIVLHRPQKWLSVLLLLCLLLQLLLLPTPAGARVAHRPASAAGETNTGIPVPAAPEPIAPAHEPPAPAAPVRPTAPERDYGPQQAPMRVTLTLGSTAIQPSTPPASGAITVQTYQTTASTFTYYSNPKADSCYIVSEQMFKPDGTEVYRVGWIHKGSAFSVEKSYYGIIITSGSGSLEDPLPGKAVGPGAKVVFTPVKDIPGKPFESAYWCNSDANPNAEPSGKAPASCPNRGGVTTNAVQLEKTQEKVVMTCLSVGRIRFFAIYDSYTHYQGIGAPGMGKGWTYTGTDAINSATYLSPCSAATCLAGYEEKILYRPDGPPISFQGPPDANGFYRKLGGNYATLKKLSDGSFELRYASGDRELFDSGGNLTRTEDRLGNATTVAWSVASTIGTLKITDVRTGQCLLAEHQQKPDPDFGTVWRLMVVKDCATNGGPVRQVTFSYGTSGNDLNRLVKIVDAGGRVQQVRYDALGRIVTRFNPSNNPDVSATARATQISYAHTTGRTWIVARETQLNGATVDFAEVAGKDWNTEITYKDAAGTSVRVERYTRDGAGRLLRVYNRNSTTDYTAMTYDAAGNLTSVVDPEGRKTEYVYNAAGDMTEARAYTGTSTYDATTMAYDSYGNLTKLTEPEGAVTRWGYNASTGLLETVAQVSASETLTTTITYDPVTINGVAVRMGLPTKVTLPDGTQHRFAYDSRGYPATTTYDLDRTGHTGLKLTESFEYDWRGVLLASTNLQGIRTEYEYTQNPSLGQFGALGWPSAAVLDKPTSGTGRQVRTAYTYDAVGNLTKLVADAGDSTKRNATTAWTYAVVGSRGTYAPTQETDAVGQVTRYSYDVMGDIYQVEQSTAHNVPNGLTTTYAHDERGWLVQISRNNAIYQQIQYNKAGQVTAVTDALDRWTAYTYDAKGRLKTVQPHYGVDSATSTYDYDKNDRLTTVTDPLSRVTRYTYDAFNRVKDVTNGAGDLTSYRYDNRHRLTLVTAGDNIDAEQIQVQYAYDAVDRPTKTVVNPGGLNLTTQYSYVATGNSDRWNLKHVIDPEGGVSTRTYNSLGLLAGIYDTSANLPSAGYWQYEYTNLGTLSKITPPTGAPTSYESDTLGRTTKLTRNGQSESWVYNPGDTVRTFTDFAGQVTSYTYDAYGRLTKRDAVGTTADATYTYAANDLLKTATSTPGSSGQLVTTFKYDSRNNLEQVERGTTVMASYTYNLADEQTAITHGGQTTTYDYDGAGRLKTVNAWGGGASTTTYTAAGLPKLTTRPNGVSTAYDYDTAGRQKRIHHHKGATTLNDLRYGYDPNGNRTTMDDQFGRTTYAYDGLNRLIGATYPAIPNGPAASSEAFRYDAVGNRTFRGNNLAPLATVSVSTQANSTTYAAAHAKDGGWGYGGNPEWVSTETNPWIQLTWSSARSIDRISLFDRLATSHNVTSGTLSFSDGTSIAVSDIPANGTAKDVTFPAKTVTWVKFQVSGGNTTNMGLSEIQAFQGATTLTYDASDRIAPGQGYVYSSNGNLIQDAQNNAYKYDSLNRLTETYVGGTPTTYTYDALDTMYEQGTTTLSYDLTAPYSQLIGEYQQTTGAERHYAYGVGGVYAQQELRNGVPAGAQVPLGNHQGSLTNLTDSAGGLLASSGYAAHGQARGSSRLPSGLGFTGEPELAGGVTHLRARGMHKDTGRFLQRDSLDTTVLAMHAPVGANRYVALNGDPVNSIDPSGHLRRTPLYAPPATAGYAPTDAGTSVGSSGRELVNPLVPPSLSVHGGSPGVLIPSGGPQWWPRQTGGGAAPAPTPTPTPSPTPQPAPGSRQGPVIQVVGDSNIFMERWNDPAQKARVRALLHDPLLIIRVPKAAVAELLNPKVRPGVKLAQLRNLGGFPKGAKIVVVPDGDLSHIPEKELQFPKPGSKGHDVALSSNFGWADAKISQRAVDDNLPLLTINDAMRCQINGNPLRKKYWGGVRFIIP